MSDKESINKKKFLRSLHNEDLVMRNLPLELYRIGANKLNGYDFLPTAFVQLKNGDWLPVEIKASVGFHKHMNFVELKKNQVLRMAELRGAFLISGERDYTIIEANNALADGVEIDSKFLKKECYRLVKEQLHWYAYPSSILLRS